MTEGQAILAAGALLAAALGASLLAGRVRVPGLLLFLGLGMLLGSDAIGWIDFDDYETARIVGIVALSLILFEGGLTAGLQEIRPVLVPAAAMAVVGTLVTAVITGLVAAWLFDLTTLEGLLVGAILSSTDGAAVFAVLRGSTLRRRLARTLEGEAGFNDPVAVLLVLGFIEWVRAARLRRRRHGGALRRGDGGRAGRRASLVGVIAVQALKATRLASAGLYPVASLAIAGHRLRRRRRPARLGLPRGVPRRAGARHGAHPGQADDHHLPRGHGLARPGRDVPGARPAGLPVPARRRLARGHRARVRDHGGRPADGGVRRHAPDGVHRRRARRARLGGAARGGSRGAGDLPGDRRGPRQSGVLQHRLLRRARLDARCRAPPSRRSPGGWA